MICQGKSGKFTMVSGKIALLFTICTICQGKMSFLIITNVLKLLSLHLGFILF